MNDDLISRSALRKEFEREGELNPYDRLFFEKVVDVINNAPTVSPEKALMNKLKGGEEE